MKNDWFYDSAYMDEDQNSDLSDGQLGHSVGISQSVVVIMEEEQNLEQLKVNFHAGIQHSKIGWALSNLDYERKPPYHIQDLFYACYG